MLERAKEIIEDISKQTDEVILFHSLSGKDSIVLLDLLYGKFKRIVCVYMYLVPNLDHIQRYFVWAKKKYPNIEFVQVPHYGYYDYVRKGFMGCKRNEKQTKWTLADITEKIREKTGIEWACFGFKQSDSLNRRLMLRSYKDDGKLAISWGTKKFYPLSTYKNKDMWDYIAANNLKQPETYGCSISQSCGCDITSVEYQTYLKLFFPQDLEKIYTIFPQSRMILLQNKDEER
jgi:3'-phosphoadenosine 5'-phosphosulfate sulfotransferase (PAPS reductase)/FAD synthetase